MKIELTDLEEDILVVAHRNPDMTNEEIAEKLDCSASWVTETRNKYESKVPDSEIPNTLNGDYSNGGGGSLLGGLFYLCVVLPAKLTFWALEVSAKLTLWAVALPFKLLSGGSESN